LRLSVFSERTERGCGVTDIYIGIDPGVSEGVAFWNPDTQTLRLETLDFWTLIDALESCRKNHEEGYGARPRVVIEASWNIKTTYVLIVAVNVHRFDAHARFRDMLGVDLAHVLRSSRVSGGFAELERQQVHGESRNVVGNGVRLRRLHDLFADLVETCGGLGQVLQAHAAVERFAGLVECGFFGCGLDLLRLASAALAFTVAPHQSGRAMP